MTIAANNRLRRRAEQEYAGAAAHKYAGLRASEGSSAQGAPGPQHRSIEFVMFYKRQTRKQWKNGGRERKGRRFREAHRKAQNGRCRLCGVEMDPENGHVATPTACTLDHIVPLSKGGEHTMENTQALCWTCNIKKSYSE